MKEHSAKGVLIFTIILLIAACAGKKEKSKSATGDTVLVRTQTVSSTPAANEVTFSGNTEGSTTVKLGFMVPGKVKLISFKTGQVVAKRQLIAALEETNYALNKKLADVQVNETLDEFGRLKSLHDRGSLSESDFSKISSALQKVRVQQSLEIKNLKDSRLYSPIRGVLLSKQVEVGEIVEAGNPLFVVSDIRKVCVIAFVPEVELGGLRIGKNATIYIAALDQFFAGKITEIGALADAASRTFTVKFEVDNPRLLIRPGMIAEVRIEAGTRKGIIELPAECITNDPGNQSYVYVADNAGQRAFKRKVSLGKMDANRLEILSGLTPGERVIVSGQTKLSDGASITIEK